jgi:hypothetical protein
VRECALQLVTRYDVIRWGRSIRYNRSFGSVFDLGQIPVSLQAGDYATIIAAARAEPFELMVHPSEAAASMTGLTRIGPVSQAEGDFLRTGALKALIRSHGFELATYRDVT